MSYKNEKIFKDPSSEFRGAPFWAWNSRLEKEQLTEQIEIFKQMGMGGFHIHSRSGLAVEYLGEEFMNLVKLCHKKAAEEGLLCYLYDEDRWPSGAAGGLVTIDKQFRSRFLVLSVVNDNEKSHSSESFSTTGRALRSNDRTFLARYSVKLNDGYLESYKRLAEGEKAEDGATEWEAWLELNGNSPWYNNQAYVNVLDKKAIDRFIEITHEAYYKALGADFGKSVPSIFTDEPQVVIKKNLNFASDTTDIINPFTDDLDETFKAAYGESLLDSYPEVIWDLPGGKISKIRYWYHDHICERFANAFTDNIGDWCEKHSIAFTGHLMSESTLQSQTNSMGEAMRFYRGFHIPGIDILSDKREFSTAKQTQSAKHQYGRKQVLSELYGVTNWDYDFRGHKSQGDWQAALGVTLRVHHLTWVSMNGEAKRDYPASIGYQSPWYKEYPYIENHFARLNTALTSGEPIVRIGVIHPIESFWLYCGTNEKTGAIRSEMERNFNSIIEWLLFGLTDFDFISESLLPELTPGTVAAPFTVGKMAYDVIIVPNCVTLRRTTLTRLESFVNAGGKVIFTGTVPTYIDATKSSDAQSLVQKCQTVPFSPTQITAAVEKYREIDIISGNGSRVGNMIYQLRQDGDDRWLFICNANKQKNKDIASAQTVNIIINGEYAPVLYDTMTGEIEPINAIRKNGKTHIHYKFYEHDSLLLLLQKHIETIANPINASITKDDFKPAQILTPLSYSLSEPNVLLLTTAEYSFDGGEWQPNEEILRIDNEFRKKLGYPLRMEALAQPWVREKKTDSKHELRLRFTIESETALNGCSLALESSSQTKITLNGNDVLTVIDGYFVDKCIKQVPLPELKTGRNELVLSVDYNDATDIEWYYLLGDFNVRLSGKDCVLTEKSEKIAFGDYTYQGLPFYAGNITYNCEIDVQQGFYQLETSHYRAPLLKVSVDGRDCGIIAFSPYRVDLGELSAGKHQIAITSFGNRVNAFGAVHNANTATTWFGPNAWRTNGSSWSYEYQLKQMGVLVSPVLLKNINLM